MEGGTGHNTRSRTRLDAGASPQSADGYMEEEDTTDPLTTNPLIHDMDMITENEETSFLSSTGGT